VTAVIAENRIAFIIRILVHFVKTSICAIAKRNVDKINRIIVYNSSITNPDIHLQVNVLLVGKF
jgi:hypothetical protein